MDNIILASLSPRRRELLEKFNVKHTIIASEIKEIVNAEDGPYEVVMSLAFNKAYNIGKEYTDNIIIGADTIVVYENQILGKPKDSEDAKRILNLLSGNYHKVITGIALINIKQNIKIIDFEETLVKFRELDQGVIDRYIETNEPFDKAGAYGIQGFGGLLVEKIDGCYDNVIGLPMGKLNNLLNKHFNISIL